MSDSSSSTSSNDNPASPAPTPLEVANQAASQGGEKQEDKPAFQPPASQDELNRIVEARLARERAKFSDYAALKEKAAKYDEAEDAKKTAEQRSAEKITALEQELETMRLGEARARIAAEKGVSAELLAGANEEELVAHAEKIAAAIEQAKSAATPPRGTHLPGEATGKPPAKGDWLRSAFGL